MMSLLDQRRVSLSEIEVFLLHLVGLGRYSLLNLLDRDGGLPWKRCHRFGSSHEDPVGQVCRSESSAGRLFCSGQSESCKFLAADHFLSSFCRIVNGVWALRAKVHSVVPASRLSMIEQRRSASAEGIHPHHHQPGVLQLHQQALDRLELSYRLVSRNVHYRAMKICGYFA